ncbi:MAG: BTAD domain-containing putative transcriptional regulator, partial [Gemmatimonadota bacterium]|nr:BTAD domain-containing putative transcriptional regulator [Gemmatimonadota bacterium]
MSFRPSADDPSGSGPVIELYALGRTDLRVDGDVAARVLSQPKRLGLLAYLLLLRPRGIHLRESLFPIFWPESSEPNARLSLNQSLAFLRRELGSDAIVSHGRTAVEVPRSLVHCDVLMLEEAVEEDRLEEGLRLYRGEILPGLHVSRSRQFERWLDGERDRLRALALGAADRLVDRLAAAGRLDEAVRWCAWAGDSDPLNGDLIRRLLDLLGRTGDERRLRAAFRGYIEALDSALGVAPPPVVEDAFRAAVARAREVRRPASLAPEPAVSKAREEIPVVVLGGDTTGAGKTGRVVEPGAWSGRRGRVLRRVAAALATASVLVAAYLARAGSGAAEVSLDARRALLAPLAVIGEGPDRGWLARAAVDWAARELARTGVVQVVAPGLVGLPTVSRDPDARAAAPSERAFQAGAGLVVSGALSERDGRDQLDAVVVETSTGRILSRVGPVPLDLAAPATGLASFSDRVAAAVAVAADPTLGEWVSTVREPPDFLAYRRFSDGLDALAGGRSLDAADDFMAAANRDPAFVTAKIWAVRAFVDAHRHRQADSIARSILHLRPDLTGWDRAMLDYYTGYLWGTWEEAYQAARELVRITPDVDWRHLLAGAALATGRPDE